MRHLLLWKNFDFISFHLCQLPGTHWYIFLHALVSGVDKENRWPLGGMVPVSRYSTVTWAVKRECCGCLLKTLRSTYSCGTLKGSRNSKQIIEQIWDRFRKKIRQFIDHSAIILHHWPRLCGGCVSYLRITQDDWLMKGTSFKMIPSIPRWSGVAVGVTQQRSQPSRAVASVGLAKGCGLRLSCMPSEFTGLCQCQWE